MSISTDKMKEEIKNDLCQLLNIPKKDEDGTVAKIIDKIISCAVLEAMSTISKATSMGRGTIPGHRLRDFD